MAAQLMSAGITNVQASDQAEITTTTTKWEPHLDRNLCVLYTNMRYTYVCQKYCVYYVHIALLGTCMRHTADT